MLLLMESAREVPFSPGRGARERRLPSAAHKVFLNRDLMRLIVMWS